MIDVYKRRSDEYFERASYIKKTVLAKNQENVNEGGGSAAAHKKKYEF